jgi:FMN phosphatase YigB (HAD superfamily)
MQKAVIFDFNRTLYDPEKGAFMKGAIASLESLKKNGVMLFLIGKGTDERASLINELGLHRYFDEIIVREEKELKDFEYLKKKYAYAVFYAIGDRVKKEITFGNLCGFKTIWFKNGKFADEVPENKDEKPWKTIRGFGELPSLIAGEN